MRWRYSLSLAAMAASVCAIGYAAAEIDAEPGPERAPLTPLLHIQGYTEAADGSVGSRTGTTVELVQDEFRTLELHVNPSTCAMTAHSGSSGRAGELMWIVDARLIDATEDSAVVDLRWAKHAAPSDRGLGERSENRQRAILHYGDSRTLDMDQGADCGRIFVDLQFRLKQPLSVLEAALRYEMWLIHRSPDGSEVVERLLTSARQDAKLEYFFAPIRHTPHTLAGTQEDSLESAISGTVRGRARPDGLIDLTLFAMRVVTDEDARMPANQWQKRMWVEGETIREWDSRGAVGLGGFKQVTVRPLETVEFTLPPPAAQSGNLDLGSAFAGHTTAIRVTTTRLK